MNKIFPIVFCLILVLNFSSSFSLDRINDSKLNSAYTTGGNRNDGSNGNNNETDLSSKVCYSIAEATGVRITIFDVFAREVATVVNEFQQPGSYEADLNKIDLPAGTYYYKIQTGSNTQVNKIVLVK
jgi:hypothetical protein